MPRRNRRRHVYSDRRLWVYPKVKTNSCSAGENEEDSHNDAHTGVPVDHVMSTEGKSIEQENHIDRMNRSASLVRKYTKSLRNHRKPGQGCCKAHSNNKRKDRAISTIYRMLKSADKAQRRHSVDSGNMITG